MQHQPVHNSVWKLIGTQTWRDWAWFSLCFSWCSQSGRVSNGYTHFLTVWDQIKRIMIWQMLRLHSTHTWPVCVALRRSKINYEITTWQSFLTKSNCYCDCSLWNCKQVRSISIRNVGTYLWFFYNYLQAMIQKCSTGHVGIEDSADGSAMLRSTSLVITVALEDTGRPAKIKK